MHPHLSLLMFLCVCTGEGMVEMQDEQVTCSSEDDEVHVAVIRKSGRAFATEVTWSAQDGDALAGQHYAAKEGKIKQNSSIISISVSKISHLNFMFTLSKLRSIEIQTW